MNIRCKILKETDLALLIRQEPKNREPIEVWIPKSQCEHISRLPMSASEQEEHARTGIRDAKITVAKWIGDKKGLWES